MKENRWLTVVKGLLIGATMIVPGVSGGTMAMILGIYDHLISAVSSFGKNVKENLIFLLTFSMSAGAGLFVFSAPLSWLLEHYKFPVMCFFIIVIICGIPVIGKKSGIRKVSIEVVAYMVIGAALVAALSKVPENILNAENFVGLILAGSVSAVALILPGISFSHFLLILGIYERLLNAVRSLDVVFLFPLGIGVFGGIILLSKLLESFMEKYPKQTYMIILGFIMGSVAEIIVTY